MCLFCWIKGYKELYFRDIVVITSKNTYLLSPTANNSKWSKRNIKNNYSRKRENLEPYIHFIHIIMNYMIIRMQFTVLLENFVNHTYSIFYTIVLLIFSQPWIHITLGCPGWSICGVMPPRMALDPSQNAIS